MSKDIRIREALEKTEANIAYLAILSDSTLSEKLETIHIQMELAEQKKNTEGLELLEIWRSQIIQARIYKAENEIPDAPNEIEAAIADIETFIEKTEQRQEILKEANDPEVSNNPIEEDDPKVEQPKDDYSQLSLF